MIKQLELPKRLEPQESLIQQVMEIAVKYYTTNDAAHDFDHALRVTRLALRIGQKEKANLEVLALAALLHDTARGEQERTGVCHAQRGAEIADLILSEIDYDPKKREHVMEMIRTHRFRDELKPETLEAQILYDADKLDAIGAIGIGRSYAVSGIRGQRMYSAKEDQRIDEDSPEYSPAEEYRFKLRKIVDKMLTSTGRKMARTRHEFMVYFFEQLEEEVSGQI
jgi:uncharacterized protein